jgi:glycosyltransferase involved in cell wall biosynthesis
LTTVQKYRPTIIHSFLPLITFMGAITGRIYGIRLIISSRRALGTHQRRFPLLIPFDYAANRLSHYITANSKAVQTDLVEREHVDKTKTVLIYNGIDADRFNRVKMVRHQWRTRMGIKNSCKVIISLANLIPYKGHSDLLYAIKEMNEYHDALFWFVGEDRGIRSGLNNLARELGVDQRIEFLGTRLDIPELLAASDISVLASHEEGFSNVILESMAAGLPVVATDVGGNGEAVVDGVTGWLVPPKNPKALAEKIIDLLENPDRAETMGEQGRKRVKAHFSVEALVNNHLALYRSGADD